VNYRGECVDSGNFGDADNPRPGERCSKEYCDNGNWKWCSCWVIGEWCSVVGAYYSASESLTEACKAIENCGTNKYYTCICQGCYFSSDCAPCSNNVKPICDNGVCKCKPCEKSSDCEDQYCCKYEIDRTNNECVSKGTIYYYGGKSYLCT